MPSFSALPYGLSDARGRLTFRALLALALLGLALFLPGQMTVPAIDRDEARFVQATRQMLETGDFIDIRFQDEARYQKPVGIYWLQAASVKFFAGGDTSALWAYRLPSLFGALLSVLLTALIGARLFGPTVGLMAGAMLAGSILLNAEARLAKTDAMLLATILMAQWAMAKAWMRRFSDKPAEPVTAIVFWLGIVIGTLIKGPIIWLVVGATLLALRFTEKGERKPWVRTHLRPLTGIGAALLLTAPWFIAIMLKSHGHFAEASAGRDLLAKIWEGQNGIIGLPGFHSVTFWATAWPFSLLVLMALPWIWKHRKDANVRFCLCWILPTWFVFELTLTKLLHYTLPVWPAIAVLTARAMLDNFGWQFTGFSRPRWRWLRPAGVALWLLLTFALLAALLFMPLKLEAPLDPLQATWSLIALVASSVAGFLLLKGYPRRALACLCVASLCVIPTTFGRVLPHLERLWPSRAVLAAMASDAPCATTQLITAGYNEPSIVFAAGTRTRFVETGEAAVHALKEDPCRIALIDDREEAAFIKAAAGEKMPLAPLGIFPIFNYARGSDAILRLYKVMQ